MSARTLALIALAATLAACAPAAQRAPATSLDAPPTNNTTTRAAHRPVLAEEPWTAIDPAGRRITTPAWSIATTVPTLSAIDRDLPAFLEAALAEYRTRDAALPPPPRRLDLVILATRPQWARFTSQHHPDQAPALLRIERGGYTIANQSVLYDIGPRDTLALAAHEGWHLYTRAAFAEPLPLWLEEGLAATMEGARTDTVTGRPLPSPWANVERFDELRDAVASGRVLTLPDLLASGPVDILHRSATADDALTWYAQAWALILFLREHDAGRYRRALRDILTDAAAGRLTQSIPARLGAPDDRRASALTSRNGPAVFLAYINKDLDAANNDYQRFLHAITRPGAKDRIVAGRSPLQP